MHLIGTMRAPLPAVIPDRIEDYAPGRIIVVPEDEWPITVPLETTGVRTSIPRYALDVRTLPIRIDPERVRWLTEKVTTRPLDARHVHLTMHQGLLYLVKGHHTLAAQLITGAERVAVRLVRPLDDA